MKVSTRILWLFFGFFLDTAAGSPFVLSLTDRNHHAATSIDAGSVRVEWPAPNSPRVIFQVLYEPRKGSDGITRIKGFAFDCLARVLLQTDVALVDYRTHERIVKQAVSTPDSPSRDLLPSMKRQTNVLCSYALDSSATPFAVWVEAHRKKLPQLMRRTPTPAALHLATSDSDARRSSKTESGIGKGNGVTAPLIGLLFSGVFLWSMRCVWIASKEYFRQTLTSDKVQVNEIPKFLSTRPARPLSKDKTEKLRALAEKRKRARYPGHACLGDFDGGKWECDYVSPYTKAAHNSDSKILIFLQDWCAQDDFKNGLNEIVFDLGYYPNCRTNKNLINLLRVHFCLELDEVYATNWFPFFKQNKSSQIPQELMLQAGNDFGLDTIDIIQPKIVVCLGQEVFDAVRVLCGHKRMPDMETAITHGSFEYPGKRMFSNFCGARVFCQAHTGYWGTINRNRGGVDRVSEDWARMASYFRLAEGA